jgi:formamidopyrimidine-DNA glycosylase
VPELPEVEAYARYFAAHALRQKIVRVDVRDERILATGRDAFVRALRGHAFTSVRRHGKHFFAEIAAKRPRSPWLHLHFGMTGDLAYYRDTADEPRFARVVFVFANGAQLAFEDMRLFGVVELTPDPDTYIAEHHLGPDPLQVSLREFRAIAATRRGAMKSLLMSQDVIAGVGNLYADETLFRTGIHPKRAVDRLTNDEVRAVYTAMRAILREAIARRTTARELPHNWLTMHREEGERCPTCGGTIQRATVFGRTTYFCGKHQR